jgi:hypothetical protein
MRSIPVVLLIATAFVIPLYALLGHTWQSVLTCVAFGFAYGEVTVRLERRATRRRQ